MKRIALLGAICALTTPALADKKQSFERTLTLNTDRISAIELNTGAGSLEVVGTSGNDIVVNATVVSDDYDDMTEFTDAFDKKMVFSIDRQTEYAVVTAKAKKSMYNSPDIQINLEVAVPRGLDVLIDDGSGSIHVENLDGELTVDDGSGSVVIKDINNDVNIDDGSGSLSISGVSGNLVVDDGSGSVDMKNIAGTVEIEDGSGSISAKFIGGDFILDDGSGDVVIKELTGDFELVDDGSGTIKVNGKKINKR
ncbi:hypothetical protein ACFODZ_00395 [Marinicella sediminis]|uniref:Adhesin domain-containing protein n=1 Tax=Marinicella sediminis TaxID=1792834 RepID=A0ABV7J722_9GAMM|nr:hypothetical protein [Marinicella sediminis]